MKKLFSAWLAILLLLLVRAACADSEITEVKQLNAKGVVVGVSQGSVAELAVRSELPEAGIVYYTDSEQAYLALTQNKIQAYVSDYNQMRLALAEGVTGVHLLEESMNEPVQIAVGISPVSKIPDLENSINQFIARIKTDGTLDDMYRRWIINEDLTMPEIVLPEKPALHLTVGTAGVVPPYSYYEGTKLNGFDIELAYRFAAWLGVDIEFKVFNFAGLIPAAATGNVDCIFSNLNITPERQEALPFSDVLYEDKLGVMVRGDAVPAGADSGPADMMAMNGKNIGVQTGTICDVLVEETLPEAKIKYFNSQADILAALEAGKVDAWCSERPVVRFMAIDHPGLSILDGELAESNLAAIFPKTETGQALRDQYSAFVDQLWTDGTMQEIDEIWFGRNEEKRTVLDYEALPDTNGTLRMAIDTTLIPFAYVKDNREMGYDVDIAARFCQAYGYRLKVVPMNFDGVLASVQTGKCDFGACGITVTEERAEQVLFSTPNYHSGIVLAVMKSAAAADLRRENLPRGVYTSLEELQQKTIGIPVGTSFDLLISESFPEAQLDYYNNQGDLLAALAAGKIDTFPSDEPVIRYIMNQREDITYIPEDVETFEFAYCFAKTEEGQRLCDQISDFILGLKTDGTLGRLSTKWFGTDESEKPILNYQELPATNGTLVMATDVDYVPFEYLRDGMVVGYDVEIAALFCQAYGYGLRVEIMNLDSVLPAIQTGKCSFGGSAITITPERAESVLFSEPNYTSGTVMVVKAQSQTGGETFWEGIVSSFRKTFFREERWKLFLEGILITLVITVLSAVFGTALGFGIFMLCRNGNRAANGITRWALWLVQGMPMVVLLMILYYIVFGSVAISGIVVAVIGFTLTFGGSVFGLLKMGVGAVDGGQYEAAYALGYSNPETFFRIILPQALPHVLPAYKGEIVGLIKATSIVGYIAVQDLTKMGDIVRSRTYEAFFPLIAVTVIYFALEALLGFLVSKIEINLNPKRRRKASILKGVKTDD